MVYVYLSDESIDVARSNEAPRVGEHLGDWVLVLAEAHRFRTITECNQVAIPVAITDVLSLGAILGHIKENTPANPEASRILSSIKDQLDTVTVVEIPPPPDEVEPQVFEADFAEAELRVANELIHNDEETRETFTIFPDDVAEISPSDLFEDEE